MTTIQTATTTTSTDISSIELATPQQACTRLGVAHDVLLGLINTGQLAAYDLGGNIRFKVTEVRAAAALLTAA